MAPRQRKYLKAQRGSIPVRTGGSEVGNYLTKGQFGLQLLEGCILSDAVLITASTILKRQIKDYKTSYMIMRVFPDIPVSRKSQGIRMGKGKCNRAFWACRVPKSKIIFEIFSKEPNLIPDVVAKDALRIASHCLPVKSTVVDINSMPPKPVKIRYPDAIPKPLVYHKSNYTPKLII